MKSLNKPVDGLTFTKGSIDQIPNSTFHSLGERFAITVESEFPETNGFQPLAAYGKIEKSVEPTANPYQPKISLKHVYQWIAPRFMEKLLPTS